MPSAKNKNNSLKPFFVILLSGFFYINVRLIAECLMQYHHIGRRAMEVLWGDNPFLITLTDVTTAAVSAYGIYSLVRTLLSPSHPMGGLLFSLVYFLAFFIFTANRTAPECLLFSHWFLLNSMIAFLILFVIYLIIHTLFKKQRV